MSSGAPSRSIGTWVGLGCLLASPAARAADVAWIEPLGGDFQYPLNWSTGLVPGSADIAAFDQLSFYTVSFSDNALTAGLQILNDRVTFDLNGFTYTVTANADPVFLVGGDPESGLAARLTLVGGTLVTEQTVLAPDPGSVALVEVGGAGTAWNLDPSGNLTVGAAGSATVEIVGGASVDVGGFLSLAEDPGSEGSVAVVGPGSNLTMGFSGDLFVGLRGTGSLFITNGGSVVLPDQFARIAALSGSAGTVVVSGDQSLLHAEISDVGERGPGSIEVLDGATVIGTSNSMILAREVGGSGSLIVSGPGSLFEAHGSISLKGEGEIRVENGAQLIADDGLGVATQGNTFGSMTVMGAGTYVQSVSLALGAAGPRPGPALFTVGQGAVVETMNNGVQVANISIASVSDPGSLWTTNDIFVGGDNVLATLDISAGGAVLSRDAKVGFNPEDRGLVVVTGGTSQWTLTRDLYLGASGAGALGSLLVEGGASVTCDRVVSADAAGSMAILQVTGSGSEFAAGNDVSFAEKGEGLLTISGAQSFQAAKKFLTGTFAGSDGEILAIGTPMTVGQAMVLASAGHASLSLLDGSTLSAGGTYSQGASGELTIEVTPLVVPVQVTLAATLNGTLEVRLADGFDPPQGEFFDVLTAASVTGVFSTVLLPVTPGGVQLFIDYLPDRVRIYSGPAPGDINGDGTINVVDFLLLLKAWGPCPDCQSCPADLDGDCQVGITDLLLLLGNWS